MFIGQEGKEFVDSVLNDLEREEMRNFANNETLVEAIRKVLLIPVYNNGVLKKGKKADMNRNFMLNLSTYPDLTDEELGRQARASARAVELLEMAFQVIDSYRELTLEKVVGKNPAR